MSGKLPGFTALLAPQVSCQENFQRFTALLAPRVSYQGMTLVVPQQHQIERTGFSPCMAQPSRNAATENVLASRRFFFATTRTHMSRRIFQTERNANLLIDTLRSLVAEHKFIVHDFVIMPDHFHVLLEIDAQMTIEKAMQFIKGRFSHCMKTEQGVLGEIWQRGFSELRITDAEQMNSTREYIANNPVKAGLVTEPNEYPFCFRHLASMKHQQHSEASSMQGLKPN